MYWICVYMYISSYSIYNIVSLTQTSAYRIDTSHAAGIQEIKIYTFYLTIYAVKMWCIHTLFVHNKECDAQLTPALYAVNYA